MRKIVTPQEIAEAEARACHDGADTDQFMRQAGKGVADIAYRYLQGRFHALLLCSTGNNSGDAYVTGCELLDRGVTVIAWQIGDMKSASPLCRIHHQNFCRKGGQVVPYAPHDKLPIESGIIIDGFFGTGFHGAITGPYASIIEKVNASELPVIAVDIPSGLNGTTGRVETIAIHATATAFLEYPKIGFFLQDGWDHTGSLEYVPFGLPDGYISNTPEKGANEGYLLDFAGLVPFFPKPRRSRHKYEAGYVVSLAGSPNMPGAAILTSLAALRGGAGIVRLLHPDGMQAALAGAPFELIRQPYPEDGMESIWCELNRASASLIGPGLGMTSSTRDLLHQVMAKVNKPCVIDADALNLYAESPYPLPPHTVFTPHRGEMGRLLQETSKPTQDATLLKRCQDYAEEHYVTLVLKGTPTFIFHPGVPYLVSTRGDPGMATAGSGDVLTGIIAALLAQQVPQRYAAALAVYIHGLAGEHAAHQQTSHCMIATDIINALPYAYRSIGLTM